MSGAVLAHRVEGEGPPVLLLNGGLMTMLVWEPLARGLAERHRVVRCDFRGQLLTSGPPPRDIDGHARDVLALLDHLGLDRVHVAGVSFGAFVALALAAAHAERVASVLAATAAERVTEEAWAGARPVVEACRAASAGGDGGVVFDLLKPATFGPRFLGAEQPTLAERRARVAAMPREWFASLAGLIGALEGLDLRPRLGDVTCPVKVVAAAEDRTFPPERSRALHAALPHATIEIVPDAGHALVVEAPLHLLAILRAFLAEVAGPGGES
jgi:pimeloyl-ACP methyl ester carboxylesterase